MRYLTIALIVALALPLTACVTGTLGPDGASIGVEPLVGLSRLKESENAAKEYGDALSKAIQSVAKTAGDAQAEAQAQIATAQREAQQQQFDLSDVLQSEWFYAILAALGLGEVGRRKYKKAKEQLPEGYEEVADDATETV